MNIHRLSPKWIALLSWLLAILIVPVIPFFALGWILEPKIEHWLDACRQWPALVGSLGTVALIADIFLPVPSSFVCTTLGQILGILPGTIVCTGGLQVGSWLGWKIGRAWGIPWIERCCGKETQQMGREALEKWGGWAIAITRPIPLIAETVILLLGTHDACFSRWFPILLLSNLSIALAWCSLGYWSQSEQMVIWASIVSVLVPITVLIVIRIVQGGKSPSPPID